MRTSRAVLIAGKTDSIASGCSRYYGLGTMAVRALCLATPFHLSMLTGPETNDPDIAGRAAAKNPSSMQVTKPWYDALPAVTKTMLLVSDAALLKL